MTKFGDKTIIETDLEVKKNIDKIARLIIDEAQKIHPRDKYDIISEIVKHTSLNAALHLSIIIDFYDFPLECIAWITRNLFEMNLIIEYSIQFPEKANEFVLQKGLDEKEILEGILTLNYIENPINLSPLKERIDHLKKILEQHGKNNLKHFRVSDMARKVRMESQYNAFFKFYSKYVHPSSWLIFATEEEKANTALKNTFLLTAQYYSSRILKICQDWEKTREQTATPDRS